MFKVGDMVYVAFAVGWKFETHLTTVKDVVEKDGEVEYIVECYCDAARFSNDMFEHYDDSRKENEIFEATKEGKAKCDKYVSNYYYDGLCRGCEYENFGSVFRCTDCSHCKDMGHKNLTDPRPMKCVLNKIVVGGFYIKSHAHEICKYFDPVLPQIKREFQSWEKYNEVLKNCEFNKECPMHKNSVWKTCTYEYYMDSKLVGFPIKFMLDGREVTSVKVPRRRWVNQDFLNGDILECTTVNFAYEKGRNGLPKKECLPIYQSFEGMAKIDIKKGILIDGQPIKTL